MNAMTANLTARYEAALDLSSAGEHENAGEILAECVAADPADFEFVEAFLRCLERKLGEDSLAAVAEQALPDALQLAVDARQWGEVRRLAPPFLLLHPGHVPTLRALAEASAASGHHAIELRYLETAARAAPNDVELNRHRAKSLVRQGDFDAAIACWGRVQDSAPADPEATPMLVQLAIEQSRQRHGYDSLDPRQFAAVAQGDKQAATSVLKPVVYQDERMLREILRQADDHKRTPVQQLEAALRDHTSNPDLYLKLAALYMEKDRDYDAEKLLAKGKELCDDPRVAACWEDVQMIRLDRKLATAMKLAESDDSDPARAAVTEARKARDRFQTEVFVNRCKRDPDNAELRYELGLRHRQAGKMREAYECFAVALNNDSYKALAALEMAHCLLQDDKVVEALRFYRLAAESAQPDQLDCKKRALQEAAKLAEGIRLQRLARRYYERLQRLDPDYAGHTAQPAALSTGAQ
jgi:tetratricopeptide (TPR) repeat protein